MEDAKKDEGKKAGSEAKADDPKETFYQKIERGANEAASRLSASLTGQDRADFLVVADYVRMTASNNMRAVGLLSKMGRYLAEKGLSAEFDYFCKTGKIGEDPDSPKAEPKDA